MSWENRHYAYDTEPGYGGGGVRSWFGGLPSPGKAVKYIALANIGMFILCLATGGADGALYQALEMRTDLALSGQVWRLFTFTYLHSQFDVTHLLFNMIGLYFLGMVLERHLGARRFFAFYTVAGFVAVLMYLLVTTTGWLNPRISLVGASGGVLAVLGACAVLFPGIQVILILFPVPIRTAALIFTVLYLFNLGTRGANAGGDACHIAGLAFGIIYGYRGHHWIAAWEQRKATASHRAAASLRQSQDQLNVEVDRILDKVHRQGMGSLTRREKRTLEQVSKERRKF